MRRCTAHLRDLTLLRGTTSAVLLNNFGWIMKSTTGGFGTVSDGENDLHKSYVVGELDIFLSHSWHACWWMKYLTLLYYFNALPATLSAVATGMLWCGLQYHQGCVGVLAWRGFFPSSLLFFVVLFSWHHARAFFKSYRVSIFLDKVCIDQKDEERKAAGINAIGGILNRSHTLLVAWVSLAFATRFYDFLTEVDALKAELAVFSARKAQCFCCSNRHLNPTTGEPLSCDRAVVNASIAHWYGDDDVGDGLHTFDELIRGRFREEVGEAIRGARMPFHFVLVASVWPAMHQLDYIAEKRDEYAMARIFQCLHIMFIVFPLMFGVLMAIMRAMTHLPRFKKCALVARECLPSHAAEGQAKFQSMRSLSSSAAYFAKAAGFAADPQTRPDDFMREGSWWAPAAEMLAEGCGSKLYIFGGNKVSAVVAECFSPQEGSWMSMGRLTTSRRCFAAALQLLPETCHGQMIRHCMSLHLNLAQACVQLKAYEATVHHATRALKVDQENAKAYFRRGLAQEALGKTQAAAGDLQRAARIEPRNVDVRKKYEELKKALQELEKKQEEEEGPPNHDISSLPRAWLEIAIGDAPPKRMVFVLYADTVPKTAENFRRLCTGEHPGTTARGKPFHYKGSILRHGSKDWNG
ncbi:cyp5 [Symbiodinium pilosum]|uniref:Cyp5 protein n=1 Tax=Symbiodinium pilosum TaxID=2952 RepID=A0A812VCY0_SYMPI|nr:cyp5 [Symbiodinium pilosum]